jgi:uncharacterized protein (TIGR03083 family)
MAEDRDDLLRHYRDSRKKMLEVLHGLTDEQLSDPTLDGWAVKDHLAHLALWDDLRAAEVERISAGHESAWKMTDEQDDDYNEAAYQMRRGMSPAQARWELEHSRARLLEAIEKAPPEALDPSRYGAAGVRSTHEGQHTEWLDRWRREKGY